MRHLAFLIGYFVSRRCRKITIWFWNQGFRGEAEPRHSSSRIHSGFKRAVRNTSHMCIPLPYPCQLLRNAPLVLPFRSRPRLDTPESARPLVQCRSRVRGSIGGRFQVRKPVCGTRWVSYCLIRICGRSEELVEIYILGCPAAMCRVFPLALFLPAMRLRLSSRATLHYDELSIERVSRLRSHRH